MEIKQQNEEKGPTHWSKFSPMFDEILEINLSQTGAALYTHARAWEGKRILELGVGVTKSPLMFISTYMKRGSTFYCSDKYQIMVNRFEKAFLDSDSAHVDYIKFNILKDTESIAVDDLDADDKSKNVHLMLADHAKLPFADLTLDKIIANSVIQYSLDPRSLIREAYRVLADGGVFGVCVGGRIENCQTLFLIAEAMRQNGIDVEDKIMTLSLGDKDKLVEMFEEEGFRNIKVFYHTTYFWMYSHEIMLNILTFEPFRTLWKQASDELKDSIQVTLDRIFEERYGKSIKDPCDYEAIVLIAHKNI